MKSLILSLMDGDPIEEETPAEPAVQPTMPINTATSTEVEERNKLVAYCNNCEAWWKFVRDMNPTPEEEVCPDCGGKPSTHIGKQITTQRTFNAGAKKLTKAELKKLGA